MNAMPAFVLKRLRESAKDAYSTFESKRHHRVERYAIAKGWFWRMSVTQAGWTDAGIAVYRRATA